MRKGITIVAAVAFAVLSLSETASAYYSPSKGRFLARDPIGEVGGANLHGALGNAPTNAVDSTGLFHSAQHSSITKSAWKQTGLTFASSGFMTNDDLTEMVQANTNTDVFHFFAPEYHAQSMGFVQVIWSRMSSIKSRECWKNWAWISGDWSTLNDIGTAMHTLQDIYAHTDWVDGTNMNVVYMAYGDSTRGQNQPNAGLASLAELEQGSSTQFAKSILYAGGTNPLADDSHNRYAADTPNYGRDRGPDPKTKKIRGLPGAYSRAEASATSTSAAFILWAKNNMRKCCCEILFGKGNCNNNKN